MHWCEGAHCKDKQFLNANSEDSNNFPEFKIICLIAFCHALNKIHLHILAIHSRRILSFRVICQNHQMLLAENSVCPTPVRPSKQQLLTQWTCSSQYIGLYRKHGAKNQQYFQSVVQTEEASIRSTCLTELREHHPADYLQVTQDHQKYFADWLFNSWIHFLHEKVVTGVTTQIRSDFQLKKGVS